MAKQPLKYVATIFAFGERGTIGAGLSRYLAATGGTSLATNELAVVLPLGGKLKGLCWSAAASGLTGVNNGIVVYVNGAATPLAAGWNGAALSGGNSTVEVQVLAGDRVSVRIQLVTGGTTITRPRVSIELETDSTSRWLADDPSNPNTNIYYVGSGNVGIGTSSPQAKLEVGGDIRLRAGAVINEFSTDPTLADSSDSAVPTERAVKTYIDNFPPGSAAAIQYVDDLLAGSVTAFAMQQPPPGWLECNGQEVSRTDFARLFGRIGTTFGVGDGTTTFNAPDLRGEFIRGWDNGRTVDPTRDFGSWQSDQFQDHRHEDTGHNHGGSTGGGRRSIIDEGGDRGTVIGGAGVAGGDHTHPVALDTAKISDPTTGNHGNETRPRNVALMYCIKY